MPGTTWGLIGVTLALGGGFAGARAWAIGRLKHAIDATPTTPIGQIREPGYYEVKGRVQCARPLADPATQRPCVYYEETVYQEYVEFQVITDNRRSRHHSPSGDPKTRRARTEEQIRSGSDESPFFLDDGTGRLGIVLAGAEIEGTQESNSVPDLDAKREKYSSLQVGSRTHERRKCGVRTDVEMIPVGAEVYAIGAVDVRDGSATMYDSKLEARTFRVSVRPEEEQSSELTRRLLAWSGATLLLEGLAGAACYYGP